MLFSDLTGEGHETHFLRTAEHHQSINQLAQERLISHVGGLPGYKLQTEL